MFMKAKRNKKAPKAVLKYDTKVVSIEEQYGVNLGVRSHSKTVGEYLREQGYESFADILQRA